MSRRSFTQESADEICRRLAGGESLRTICKSDEMPAAATVYSWLIKEPSFAEQYARAREIQGDTKFDEIGDVAQQVLEGTVAPKAARVFIDATKWQAGKLRPKAYGDKADINLTGDLSLKNLVCEFVSMPAKAGK